VKKYHILAVDDEPANLYLLEEVLGDFFVDTVKNAYDMFNFLQESIPDLIILDIMMPGMDGFTAAEQLRSNPKLIDIPVIFLTARISGEDVADGLNIGAEDYIKKPFDNNELIARINKVIKNKETNSELYKKATRDNLTGLFNREYFFESLAYRIMKSNRENLKFSLGFLDIDNFKKINDTWGHQTGDIILKNLADFISRSLRDYDVLARFGGEEFVFIADGILKDQAVMIIDRIREEAARTVMDSENKLVVTFSCGLTDITEAEGENKIEDQLIKIADRRLYLAKSGGRNKVVAED
jgi:two-component system cell cycle response regulator